MRKEKGSFALLAIDRKKVEGTNNAMGHYENSSASNATKYIPGVSYMSKVIKPHRHIDCKCLK